LKKFAFSVVLCLPLLGHSQASNPAPPSAGLASPALPVAGNSLDLLQDRLATRPEQETVWQRYAAAVNAYLVLFYQERPVMASQNDPTPVQLRRLVDLHSNRLAALEDIETAGKALFSSLSAPQQAVANQLLLGTIPSVGTGAPPEIALHDKGNKPEGAHGHRGGGLGGPGGMGGGMGR
jgi:hypothetical protein